MNLPCPSVMAMDDPCDDPRIVFTSVENITSNSFLMVAGTDGNMPLRTCYYPLNNLTNIQYVTETSFNFGNALGENGPESPHTQTIDGLIPGELYGFILQTRADDNSEWETIACEQTVQLADGGPVIATEAWPADNEKYQPGTQMQGIMFGNPTGGGFGPGNSSLGVDIALRWRADSSVPIAALHIPIRWMREFDVTNRAAPGNIYQQLLDDGLEGDRVARNMAFFAFGSAANNAVYIVGSGGSYTMEIRECLPNGQPDFATPALATTAPDVLIPINEEDQSWPRFAFLNPAPVVAGKWYCTVFINSKPPLNNQIGGYTYQQALNLPTDRGAMSLNGVWYPDAPDMDNASRHGPWHRAFNTLWHLRDGQGYRETFSNVGRGWWLHEDINGICYGTEEAAFGNLEFSQNYTRDYTLHDIEGQVQVRQGLTPDADYMFDGLWTYLGLEANNSNGQPLIVELMDDNGNVLRTLNYQRDAAHYAMVNSGALAGNSVRTDLYNSRIWYYADFNSMITLNQGQKYWLRYRANAGAGWQLQAKITRHSQNGNNPQGVPNKNIYTYGVGGWAELSNDGGNSWGPAARTGAIGYTIPDLIVPFLLTVMGMPKQLPNYDD